MVIMSRTRRFIPRAIIGRLGHPRQILQVAMSPTASSAAEPVDRRSRSEAPSRRPGNIFVALRYYSDSGGFPVVRQQLARVRKLMVVAAVFVTAGLGGAGGGQSG